MKKNKEDSKNDNPKEEIQLPEMDLNKYSEKKPTLPEVSEIKKSFEKTKKDLEKIKAFILKKFPFTQAIGVIHPQGIKLLIEEELGENIGQEQLETLLKKIHLYIIIPEENFKNSLKIKKEIIAEIDKLKLNVWVYIKSPVDIWEACLDSKFDLVGVIGTSYPLYDKGILSALRVAQIHKELVLNKFDKYVVSYVIAGSLVRGDVTKESDVDSFVIINDTDVKRMPRIELKERLRAMINQYIAEAVALAGLKKNILNVQVYLLTDFWESVKDAHPVMFTFIRDGVPLYDRGTFLPWKALLKMGRLKPSKEAIEMFMSMGDKTIKRAKDALVDVMVHDIYWGVITPTQALLMLYGLPPPTPKQVVSETRKIFVEKEKMLEKKYIDILEKVVRIYKDFEHEKLKEIKGKDFDVIIEEVDDYLKRLKELKEQIEKRAEEKTINQIYEEIFSILESISGKKSKKEVLSFFEEELVKKGKFTKQHLKILNEIIEAKKSIDEKKIKESRIEDIRKNSSILLNALTEYSQRIDLANIEKRKLNIRYKKEGKEFFAELLNFKNVSFLILNGKIKRITDRLEDSNTEELNEALEKEKSKETTINPKIFDILRKELGDFEIVF
ncbi:MAG: hypothetical protein KatS3mg001_606 [Candidatus Pacearchaeota archaeon]|nr:MAG: hypothetical protein KatS3mg001_606 [Candidatus Pacearchaeota archaeon]